MVTFFQTTYVLVTFVHSSIISAVTDRILTYLLGPNFQVVWTNIFFGQNSFWPKYVLNQIFLCPIFFTFLTQFFLQIFFFSHGILHKPSASVKFWPKSFHKNSLIINLFCITNCAWFLTFLAKQIIVQFFSIPGHARLTEYKIQLQTMFKVIKAIH